ncbi:MAG: histidine kinase [Ramlibacter sp.]
MLLQLLVIEDSRLDYEMLVARLALQGVQAAAARVETAAELQAALARQPWDLVISDHHLPGFSSSEAFEIVSALAEAPPFIIVSGVIGEDTAVEAMRRGVDDYLVKSRLARLGMAVRNALGAARARREKATAEARLLESQQQLGNLSARLQTVIDEERTAIAREIHDDVGGTLTAVKLDLEIIERQAPPAQAERARRALQTLAQAAQATQRIMRNLHPPILDAGLIAALEWQVREFRERTEIGVRFSCNVASVQTDPRVAMAVYRTLQEALTNITKHATGANQVSVDVHHGAGLLSMEVSDNGRGFDGADLRKPGSLGLRGLGERARAVDGRVDISSARGRTTLLLWVPLAEDAQAGPQPVVEPPLQKLAA